MSLVQGRVWFPGAPAKLREVLAAAIGKPLENGAPAPESREDCVFLESDASRRELGDLAANAFAGCRNLKDRSDGRVFLIVEDGDRISEEIARYCLADGCLHLSPDGSLVESAEELAERLEIPKAKVDLDALLQRLETKLGSEEGLESSALQRMLARGEEDDFMSRLVDAETGLFDGLYASFKLDEEFKRARRFHQPLSLLLLDLGLDMQGDFEDAAHRQAFLAEVAAVFLNQCRDIDLIARFTESVFMVLMPGTGAAGAEVVAERMIEELQERGIFAPLQARPALGLATMPAAGIHSRQSFLARAEAGLQVSREGGGAAGFSASDE